MTAFWRWLRDVVDRFDPVSQDAATEDVEAVIVEDETLVRCRAIVDHAQALSEALGDGRRVDAH